MIKGITPIDTAFELIGLCNAQSLTHYIFFGTMAGALIFVVGGVERLMQVTHEVNQVAESLRSIGRRCFGIGQYVAIVGDGGENAAFPITFRTWRINGVAVSTQIDLSHLARNIHVVPLTGPFTAAGVVGPGGTISHGILAALHAEAHKRGVNGIRREQGHDFGSRARGEIQLGDARDDLVAFAAPAGQQLHGQTRHQEEALQHLFSSFRGGAG